MMRTAMAAGAALLLAATTGADSQQPLAPDRIQEIVERELADKDIDGVTVKVSGQDVSLEGQVRSAWEKRKAAELARDATDVISVSNGLEIARAESDDTIAQDVARKIRRYVFYSVFDHVEFAVQDGRVRLEGKVTAQYKAEEIANLASKAYGVQAVQNEIETLPASGFDTELRRRVARQIYDDPAFWQLAIGPDPPIHVVVEGGQVTLTGVVDTELQKRKAEIIARGTFGVLGVENRLRVG